jgi:TonB family protein
MWAGVELTPLQAAIIDSIASAGAAKDAPEMVRGRRAAAAGDSATMKAIADAYYRRRDARQAATLSVLTTEQRVIYEANIAVRDAGLARAKADYEARMAAAPSHSAARPNIDPAQNHGPRLIPDTLQIPYPASGQGTGVVVASFFIDTKGHVDTQSIVIRSTTSPAFMQAVCSALPTLRFSPAVMGGKPFPTLHEQTFTFDPRPAAE